MNRTNRLSALGAAALLAVGLGAVPVVASTATALELDAISTGQTEQVCPEDGKVEVEGSQSEVTVSAPEGQLISGYCVKAGEGTESVEFDEPVDMATISHSSGKDISHYTVFYVPGPTIPGPVDEEDDDEETTPPSSDDDGELPQTGPGQAAGYGLVALSLVGGGATLLALRRHA